LYLYYSTLAGVCQEVFQTFLKNFFSDAWLLDYARLALADGLTAFCLVLSPPPLDCIYYSTLMRTCQGVF
jgi:hypothetical protein